MQTQIPSNPRNHFHCFHQFSVPFLTLKAWIALASLYLEWWLCLFICFYCEEIVELLWRELLLSANSALLFQAAQTQGPFLLWWHQGKFHWAKTALRVRAPCAALITGFCTTRFPVLLLHTVPKSHLSGTCRPFISMTSHSPLSYGRLLTNRLLSYLQKTLALF